MYKKTCIISVYQIAEITKNNSSGIYDFNQFACNIFQF